MTLAKVSDQSEIGVNPGRNGELQAQKIPVPEAGTGIVRSSCWT